MASPGTLGPGWGCAWAGHILVAWPGSTPAVLGGWEMREKEAGLRLAPAPGFVPPAEAGARLLPRDAPGRASLRSHQSGLRDAGNPGWCGTRSER